MQARADVPNINFTSVELYKPNRDKLARVLENELKQDFIYTDVKWVPCPDLSEEPFNLAAPGICGKTALLDFGDKSCNEPSLTIEKKYDIKQSLRYLGRDRSNSFIFGCGYLQRPSCRILDNLAMNVSFSPGADEEMRVINRSRSIFTARNKCNVAMITDCEPTCNERGSFFLSEGLTTASVLQVHVRKLRTNIFAGVIFGSNRQNFIYSLGSALEVFASIHKNSVALGGVYVRKNNEREHGNFSSSRNNVLCANSCTIKDSEPMFCILSANRELRTSLQGSSLELNTLVSTQSLSHVSRDLLFRAESYYYSCKDDDDAEFVGYFCPAKTMYRII